jgi:hypothetical protein
MELATSSSILQTLEASEWFRRLQLKDGHVQMFGLNFHIQQNKTSVDIESSAHLKRRLKKPVMEMARRSVSYKVYICWGAH